MITDKQVHEILTEMFKRVGLEYSPAFTSQPDWFLIQSWTNKQQDEFKNWLTKYLQKKTKFKKGYCEKQASWFIFGYGWKTNGL